MVAPTPVRGIGRLAVGVTGRLQVGSPPTYLAAILAAFVLLPGAAAMLVDTISAVLLLLGAVSCLLGALGLVRLPDLLGRLQAAAKPQSLGLLLILVGTALRVELESAVTLLLVGLFQVITAPVISQLVGRSAYRSGTARHDLLVVDELAAETSDEHSS